MVLGMLDKKSICYYCDNLSYKKYLHPIRKELDFEVYNCSNVFEMVNTLSNNSVNLIIIEAIEQGLDWCLDKVSKIKRIIGKIDKTILALVKKASQEDIKKAMDNGIDETIIHSGNKPILFDKIKDYFDDVDFQPKQIKVIVVEDSKSQMEIIKKILKSLGFTVLEAENGKDAEKYLNEENVSLIISDLYMPYKDGFETCKMFKAKEVFKHVPFIALTSESNVDNLKRILALGANDFIHKPFLIDEFVARIKVQLRVRQYYDEIQKHTEEEERLNRLLIDMNEKLNNMVITDYLTGTFNRRYTLGYIEKEVEKCKRYNNFFSLVMFDIDNFKQFNDAYGHRAGDEILKFVCNIISNNIRKSDVFGRIGGEEFLVLLNETSINCGKIVAEKIREIVEINTLDYSGKKLNATISIGLTEYREGDEVSTLIERVDKALYKAKETGRNKVELK